MSRASLILATVIGVGAGVLVTSAAKAQEFDFGYFGGTISASGEFDYTGAGSSGPAGGSRSTFSPIGTLNITNYSGSLAYTSPTNFSVDLTFLLSNGKSATWDYSTLTGGYEQYNGTQTTLTGGFLSQAAPAPAPLPVPGGGILSLAFLALVGVRSRAVTFLRSASGWLWPLAVGNA